MYKFNKNDFSILSFLSDKECCSSLSSVTIKQISKHTELSIVKIRSVMKTFVMTGFASEGAMDGNSKTYYITKSGLEFLQAAINGSEE